MSTSEMSGSKILPTIRSFIPQLKYSLRKGDCGRIGVIGGSKKYTGAPYFAAISALKTGADLAHVYCPPEAAPVIKSYSPDLIVHPILGSSHLESLGDWLGRMHSIVLGPGLGRDPEVEPFVIKIVEKITALNIPLVIDADGLYFIRQSPKLIQNYKPTILTPNAWEMKLMYEQVTGSECDIEAMGEAEVSLLAKKLGGVTIVLKGRHDVISDGESVLLCEFESSPRRCGGQGDLLSGSCATFAYWAKKFGETSSHIHNPMMLAAYASCVLTKSCNKLAFEQRGRSAVTADMIDNIGSCFIDLFENDTNNLAY